LDKKKFNHYFENSNLWESYLKVESEMAQAQAKVGIIPKKAADIISKNSSLEVVGFRNIQHSFNTTKSLILSIAQELSKKCGSSGGYVHWGGTTQNIIDTGNKLVIREAHKNILEELSKSLFKLSKMANSHSKTPMLGRTLGRNAIPISFGFKVAGWIENLVRLDKSFIDAEKSIFCLFFGGAVGAMHGFENKGYNFTEALAKKLGLNNSLVPNRTSTDTSIHYLVSLSIQGMIVEKISKEILLLMSESINEISEAQSKGQIGSSTMPHKVNPQIVLNVISNASLLKGKVSSYLNAGSPVHEGDKVTNDTIDILMRESITLSYELFCLFNLLLDTIKVNKKKMKENLYDAKDYIASENLMFKLGKFIGRQKSHDLIHSIIEKSIKESVSIIDNLHKSKIITKHLSMDEINHYMDPKNYMGQSEKISKNASVLGLKYSKLIKKRLLKSDLNVRT